MAGIVGIFASIGEHIPILKKEKFGVPDPEGQISAFHYRGTCLLLLCFCIMVTCTEWISGTDSLINCLHSGPIPENVIETYCYIMGTFSVPKHYVDFDTQIGNHVAETGVGPYNPREDYIEIKAYYQWVPFVLFLQGIMFYVPHLCYKAAEGSKIKLIILGLNQWVMNDEERHSKEEELATYLTETRGTHIEWCLLLIASNALYLVNVVGQIFFTDCFLGYEFSTYGVSAASFLEEKPEHRIDPMSRVFPRMTKCTFRKFGPSGTIQRHDAQCVLPINIINEKIYVFMWFWFCILTVITVISFLFNLGVIFTTRARRIIIKRKLKMGPKRFNSNIDVDLIVNNIDFGDWKLLYHLMRNMDALVFAEFCQHFTDKLQKQIDKMNGSDDILKLRNLLEDEDRKPNPNSSIISMNSPSSPPADVKKDQEEFLMLNEGNYLQPRKSKETEIS